MCMIPANFYLLQLIATLLLNSLAACGQPDWPVPPRLAPLLFFFGGAFESRPALPWGCEFGATKRPLSRCTNSYVEEFWSNLKLKKGSLMLKLGKGWRLTFLSLFGSDQTLSLSQVWYNKELTWECNQISPWILQKTLDRGESNESLKPLLSPSCRGKCLWYISLSAEEKERLQKLKMISSNKQI